MKTSIKVIVGLLAVSAIGLSAFLMTRQKTVDAHSSVPAAATAAKKSKLHFTCRSEGLPHDGFWKSFPAVADVTRDGRVSIASLVRNGNGASVWIPSADWQWKESRAGLGPDSSCGGTVVFGDVNKDGIPDLVVADECNGVFVYLGDGQGHWKEVTSKLRPQIAETSEENEQFFTGAEGVAIGDVNGDGFPDLVVGAYDQGGITVFLGNGTGAEWTETHPTNLPNYTNEEDKGGYVHKLMLVDISGDGNLDIIANHSSGPRVWLGDGHNNWLSFSNGLPEPTTTGLFRGIAIGDVNEDGKLDMIIANAVNGPEIFLQKEGGWERTPDPVPTINGGAVDVALADMDGDGHLDLVFTGRRVKDPGNAFGVFIFRGDGKLGWEEMQGTGLPERGLSIAWGLAVTDIDQDKIPDIMLATGGIVQLPASPKVDKSGFPEELQLPRVQVWRGEAVN